MRYFLRNHGMKVKIPRFSLTLFASSRTTVQRKCGAAFLHSWFYTLGGFASTYSYCPRSQIFFDKSFKILFNLFSSGASSKSAKPEDDDSLLKQSSSQALNVEELRISENIQKKNYELTVLRERLSRQKGNTVGRNELQKKVRQAENDLSGMQTKLKNVHKEQSYRQTMKELTEF